MTTKLILRRKRCKFSAARRGAILATTLLVAACANPDVTIEEAMPLPGDTQNGSTVSSSQTPVRGQPRKTGEFPNMNTVPQGATNQMSAQQKSQFLNQMAAARGEQVAAGAQDATTEEKLLQMQEISRTHADETLKTIEKQ